MKFNMRVFHIETKQLVHEYERCRIKSRERDEIVLWELRTKMDRMLFEALQWFSGQGWARTCYL